MPSAGYTTIMADPPWPYPSPGEFVEPQSELNRASSVRRYGKMSIDELCAMRFGKNDNAQLYLWTTNAFMEDAHFVARAWGFKPKTIVTWVKVKADSTPSMGMGYHFRGATEHILYCTRGKIPRPKKAYPTAFMSAREPHSVKPQWAYDLAEERNHEGPLLELFSRNPRPGWNVWGNEVESTGMVTHA